MIHPIKYLRQLFNRPFFLSLNFCFSHKTPRSRNIKKVTLKHFKCAFPIENSCLNCLKIVSIKDSFFIKKKNDFWIEKYINWSV